MSYYTIGDFETVLFSGLQYKLPQPVLDIIEHISNDLRDNMHLMEEYKNTNTNQVYSTNASTHNGGGAIAPHSQNYRYQNSGGIDKKRPMKKDSNYKSKHLNTNGGNSNNYNNYQKKELTNSDWENLRNYKLTKVEQMEGIAKSVSEIRVLINKISEKTFETCKNKIMELVDKIMEEYAQEPQDLADDATPTNNPIDKMAVSIFNIMIANKFNSKLNAELYGLFMDKYGLFNAIIQKYISEFKHTIESIQNADPDKDYDAYCVNVKKNDARKSATTFLMNLFRLGKIEANPILDILDFFLDKTVEYIDMEDKTYVVEEITENVFLMVTSHTDVLGGYEKWKLELYSKIIHISNMKANQHPSLTNRVVFKYMDILDCL